MATQQQTPIHSVSFPGESDSYRTARNELLQAEIALRKQIEAVAEMRRRLPFGWRGSRGLCFRRSRADARRFILRASGAHVRTLLARQRHPCCL